MLEGLILLAWMLNEPQKRVRQYANFGIIERLEGLRVYPEEKDDLLKFIKENNLQKLLKKDIQEQEITNDILLNPENYYNKWYRPEVKDINDMVKNLTNGGKHQEIANTKHLYNIIDSNHLKYINIDKIPDVHQICPEEVCVVVADTETV